MDLEAKAVFVVTAWLLDVQREDLETCTRHIQAGELEAAQALLSDVRGTIANIVTGILTLSDADDIAEADVAPLVEECMRFTKKAILPHVLPESGSEEVRAEFRKFLLDRGRLGDA